MGCLILYYRGAFTLTRLTDRENLVLFLFSTLYTINIAISNVSLYEPPFQLTKNPETTN